MNPLASAVLITWKRNAAYGRRLVEDLSAEQWLSQPVAGRVLNHPAWIFSHLNLYASVAGSLIRAEPFEDPLGHLYGQNSRPEAGLSAYQAPGQLLAVWSELHESATVGLEKLPAGATSMPNPLERWRGVHPTVGDMLVTLMVKHESGHLGQLSAWRRAMGLPPVAV
ncbi:MAG: DinB family protein [Phycisphaerales bacterium]|nr:DinB family protein [Phycisphaerales bacterium]